jgi:TP901 family phage tail tape measure protein
MAKAEIIITGDTKQAVRSLSTLNTKVLNINQTLELTKTVFSALNRTVGAAFRSIVAEGAAFTKQMAKVRSITKFTAKEFAALRKEAVRIGKETKFTATQAAEGMENLARAGLDTTAILDTTAKVMDLAAATGTDLARAAEVAAINLKIFGDTGVDALDITNLIVKTTGASAQGFEHLAEALEVSAGTAKGFGVSFKDLTLILGAMANAGIRGQKAGVALNGALARLANPTREVKDLLQKLGLTVNDVNPQIHSFRTIIDRLNKSNASAADLLVILGQVAGPKFVELVQKGEKGIQEFAAAQAKANTAQEAARVAMDNLSDDTVRFDSALSGLKQSIFDTFETTLRSAVQGATSLVSKMTGVFNQLKKSVEPSAEEEAYRKIQEEINVLVDKNTVAVEEAMNALGKAPKVYQSMFASIKSVGRSLKEYIPFLKTTTEEERKNNALLKKRNEFLTLGSLRLEQAGANEKQLTVFREQAKKVIDKQLESLKEMTKAKEEDLKATKEQTKAAKKQIKTFDDLKSKFIDRRTFKQRVQDLPGAGGVAARGGLALAERVTGVTGAMAGFQAGGVGGAAIGAITDIILANNTLNDQINKLNETIQVVIDPLIVSLVPAMEFLRASVEQLTVFTKALAEQLTPIMKELVPLFKELTPLIRSLVALLVPFLRFLAPIAHHLGNIVRFLVPGVNKLADNIDVLTSRIDDLIDAINKTGGGALGGLGKEAGKVTSFIGSVGSALGFADGGLITGDRMLRLPGFDRDEGLIRAHEGETVISKDGQGGAATNNFVFNIQAIDPMSQKTEIANVIEEMFLTKRLAFAV